MKLLGDITRTKEGLRKKEMRGKLNAACSFKKKKKRKDEFWKKRRKGECGCVRTLFKTEIVEMSSNSPGFACHMEVYLKNAPFCPKIIYQ